MTIILFASGCGSSATSPSANLNLAGNWSGRFEYQTAGATVSDDVTMVILQPATTANGTWSTAGQTSGTVSFAAIPNVAGGFTIAQQNVGSGVCSGSSAITGSATATDLVLTIANITPTAACPWATGMKLTLKK